MFVPLKFYWIIPLAMAILQVFMFEPDSPFCTYLVSGYTGISFWCISSTILVMTGTGTIAMVVFTVLSINTTKQTRSASGRDISSQEKFIQARILSCLLVAVFQWLMLSGYIILYGAWQSIPYDIVEVFTLFIWPVPAMLNPILYTLTTKEFGTFVAGIFPFKGEAWMLIFALSQDIYTITPSQASQAYSQICSNSHLQTTGTAEGNHSIFCLSYLHITVTWRPWPVAS